MRGKTYTEAQRAAVVAVYESQGLAAAHKATGVSKASIAKWAKLAGVITSSGEKTQAATEARMVAVAERRSRVKEKLLTRVEELLDRVSGTYTAYVGKDAVPVEMDAPPAGVCKDLAMAVGILLDKFRLESGEVTGREEVRHDFSAASDSDLIAEAEAILREAS